MEVGVCQKHAAILFVFLSKCDQKITPVITEFSQFVLVSMDYESFAIGTKKDYSRSFLSYEYF